MVIKKGKTCEVDAFITYGAEEYAELLKPVLEETTIDNILEKVYADIYIHTLMFGFINEEDTEGICNNRIKELPDISGAGVENHE